MAVNWGILQGPSAFETAFAAGEQRGEQMRQRREQADQRNALSAYAMDPNEAGLNALAPHAPEFVLQERRRMQAGQAEQQAQQLRAAAAQGNPQAMAQLAGVDLDAWRGLSFDQRAAHAAQADVVSNVAQYVSTLPENERAAAWDQQIGQLAQRYPGAAEYQGQYSPELLQSTINEAGDFKSFYEMTQPDTFNVTAGGSVFQRDANGVVSPVVLPNYGGAPAGAPAGPPPPPPPPPPPTRQSPLFPAAEWREYTRAMGAALPAIVERDRPVIVNGQGAQVQTDVINGQIAYRVNGVWYDNPEGQ